MKLVKLASLLVILGISSAAYANGSFTYRVEGRGNFHNAGYIAASASCEPGDTLVGGGYTYIPSDESLPGVVTRNFPNVPMTEWKVRVDLIGLATGTIAPGSDLKGYAVCLAHLTAP